MNRGLLWFLLPFAFMWLGAWLYMVVIPFGWWTGPTAMTILIAVLGATVYALKRSGVLDQ